ncbi:hypothetical protein [Phyllobacterium chamaecytisi]|uniref:hypothetical protein n=1 Tax=Phyllobacterium chamaecytisi TaxID=2876082 RepID=UPI001CCDB4F0|nr:hypothetical protein [Phyllobacterium sp. KW56]MBZ9604265.1 hypothetical protein [Phyllobacterium sp. KW56]
MISKQQALRHASRTINDLMHDSVRRLRRDMTAAGMTPDQIADSIDAAMATFMVEKPKVLDALALWLQENDPDELSLALRIGKREELH